MSEGTSPASGQAESPAVDARSGTALGIGGRLLVWNTFLSLLAQAIPVVIIILLAPYLIERLGEERTGVLGISLAIAQFGTLFDAGLGRALRKRVAEALGRGARDEVPRIVGTTLGAQLGTVGVGALVLLALAPFLAGDILTIPPSMVDEARTTFFLLAPLIALDILFETLIGVLEAAQRFGLVGVVRIPFMLGMGLAPLAGVELGWDLVEITLAQLGVASTLVVVLAGLVVSVFPDVLRRPRFAKDELGVLFRFGGWISVSAGIAPILMYLERFAIGSFLGMTAVTAYTAPFELVTRLSLLPAALSATLFPAFSTLAAEGQLGRLRDYASRAVRVLLVLLVPPVVACVVFSHTILERWLGPEIADQGDVALAILSVGVVVNALAYVPLSLIQARGRPDLTAKFHAIELPIHAVVVVVLVALFGIPGAALAWTLRVALDTALLFWAATRFFKDDAPRVPAPVTP